MTDSISGHPPATERKDIPNVLTNYTGAGDCIIENGVPVDEELSIVKDPYVGMRFKSPEDTYSYYNAYARRKGFGTRKSNSEKSRTDKAVISRKFVCFKEGFNDKKDLKRKDRIEQGEVHTREGCKAQITVKRRKEGSKEFWVVTKFEDEHNHPLLTPSKTGLLRSHRKIRGAQCYFINPAKCFVEEDGVHKVSFVNEHPAKHFIEEDGVHKVCFARQSLNSHLITNQQKIQGRDAQAFIQYCDTMQRNDPGFFHSIEVDNYGCMTHFFWSDARSRMAYKYFGDVVICDMTYRSNPHGVPFVLFIGLNHHRQYMFFGGALLGSDTEASFIWLFNTWLGAMWEKHPATIITKEDDAIAKAIEQVFPTSNHHLYAWDILEKARKNLDQIHLVHQDFGIKFEACCMNSDSIGWFESEWLDLVNTYDLVENEWLKMLYNVRQKWIPAYTKRSFTAGISTNQERESFIAFFDQYVNRQTTLPEFLQFYDQLHRYQYNQEIEADYKTVADTLVLKSNCPMESQLVQLYTRANFLIFQEELCECLSYILKEDEGGEDLKTYRVRAYNDNDHEHGHVVTFNVSEKKTSCTCSKFEAEGILCRHVLKVMFVKNVMELPSHYILERWTRHAKSRFLEGQSSGEVQVELQKSFTLRYYDLWQKAFRCVEEGAASFHVFDVACNSLRRSLEEIVAAKKDMGIEKELPALCCGNIQGDNIKLGAETNTVSNQSTVCDPKPPNSKGKSTRSSSRIKESLGKQPKSVGNNHDMNTRPIRYI